MLKEIPMTENKVITVNIGELNTAGPLAICKEFYRLCTLTDIPSCIIHISLHSYNRIPNSVTELFDAIYCLIYWKIWFTGESL